MILKPLISIVCPFYNEGPGVSAFYDAMAAEFAQLPSYEFEVVCVDDGSEDDTLARLIALADNDARFRVIELSRNFGKEAALTAGLDAAHGDAVIPIDADLQDPPALIGQLIKAWEESGADVVLAKRSDRASDSVAKRFSAAAFYDLHNWLSQILLLFPMNSQWIINERAFTNTKLTRIHNEFKSLLMHYNCFKSSSSIYVSGVEPYFNPFSYGPGCSIRIATHDSTLKFFVEMSHEILVKSFCEDTGNKLFFEYNNQDLAVNKTEQVMRSCS